MPSNETAAGDFGKHLAQHRGRIAAGGAHWFAALALLASALVHGAKLAWIEAAICLLGGTAFSILPLARWRQRVDVFERGLVWRGLFRAGSLPREQICAAVFATRFRVGQREEEVTVRTRDGALAWVGLGRPQQLCQMLQVFIAGSAPSAARPSRDPTRVADAVQRARSR